MFVGCCERYNGKAGSGGAALFVELAAAGGGGGDIVPGLVDGGAASGDGDAATGLFGDSAGASVGSMLAVGTIMEGAG